jgi:hypothetical protein
MLDKTPNALERQNSQDGFAHAGLNLMRSQIKFRASKMILSAPTFLGFPDNGFRRFAIDFGYPPSLFAGDFFFVFAQYSCCHWIGVGGGWQSDGRTSL